MAIVNPNQLDFSEKKFAMIIAGFPGIGKSTLASSAPNAILIDTDKGIDRVDPKFRPTSIQAETYEELLKDIKSPEFQKFDTVIIDTGGELLELMKPYVISQNPQNGQKDGTLTLKGYGAVGREFQRFIRLLKSKDKHIVVTFHTKEHQDDNITKLRIDVQGATKDNVWKAIDIGGFMEMSGKQRTIGFSNNERYFAKGIHGIKGIYQIQNHKEGSENTFISDLFDTMKQKLIEEAEQTESEKSKYNKVMQIKDYIDDAETEKDINSLMMRILKANHALTSKSELKHHLNTKAKELGLKYDPEQKGYVFNNANSSQ